MFNYLREEIKTMLPYVVHQTPYEVKLDANEGIDWLDGLCRYPDDSSQALRLKIAQMIEKQADEILVGNGSSELIELCLKAYLASGETVVSIAPTFSMYEVFTVLHKGTYREYPLKGMTELDVDGFIAFIHQTSAKLIFLSNPNNPTGSRIPSRDIQKILRSVHAMVILDEAYADFSDQPLTDDTNVFPNLLVLRTFSKAWSLAGVRLGYMIGSKENISYVNRVRSPYNVNALTQAAGIKALENVSLMKKNLEVICAQRSIMVQELTDRGFEPLPSQANFLFFKAAPDLGRRLRERGILIRAFGGSLQGFFRLTIGTPSQNKQVLRALDEIGKDGSLSE